MDKGNSKRANGEVTHGKEREIPLDLLDQTFRWGRGELEREGEKREEEKRGENILLLSIFPGDSIVGVRRS